MVDIDLDSVLITLAFIVPIVIVGFIGYNFYLQSLPKHKIEERWLNGFKWVDISGNIIGYPLQISNPYNNTIKIIIRIDSEPPDLVNYVIFNNEDNNTLLEPNERKTILLDLSINSDYWHMNLPYPESEVYLDVYGELL